MDAEDDSVYISGTIGHVAHGKSTVVKAISGVQVIHNSVTMSDLNLCYIIVTRGSSTLQQVTDWTV